MTALGIRVLLILAVKGELGEVPVHVILNGFIKVAGCLGCEVMLHVHFS